jgi:hypothetical protein
MVTPWIVIAVLTAQTPAKGPIKPAEAPPVKATPSAPDAATPDPAKPLVPFPHPLITEVLYNVPTGEGGDANKDGTRQVAGDEFVEIVNPHTKPIDLRGYTLSDMTALEKTSAGKPKGNAIHWTFPPFTLKPGQVAVVFNGNASTIPGPIGDSSAAPAKGNDTFGGAMVFTMRQPTDKTAFANTADWVMLTAPDGQIVQLIKWGEPRVKVPLNILLVEEAPVSRAGSVQRTALNGHLAAHPATGATAFSPGVFATMTATPADPKPATPASPPERPKKGDQPATKPQDPSPPPAEEPAPKPAGPPKKPRF